MTDPISLQTVAAFPAHMAGMCDMDVVGNMLVTCGLTQQQVYIIGGGSGLYVRWLDILSVASQG